MISHLKDIQHDQQFVLSEGTRANWYSSGKVVVQGKDSEEKSLLTSVVNGGSVQPAAQAQPTEDAPVQAGTAVEPKVFIVYGHDTEARDQLDLLLPRMNIKPVILGNMAPDGKTIIEALIANTDVPNAVVLLTPDDEGHKVDESANKAFRVRQNVALEMGMFLSKLGRDRVAILQKGNLELPTDINDIKIRANANPYVLEDAAYFWQRRHNKELLLLLALRSRKCRAIWS